MARAEVATSSGRRRLAIPKVLGQTNRNRLSLTVTLSAFMSGYPHTLSNDINGAREAFPSWMRTERWRGVRILGLGRLKLFSETLPNRLT